MIKLLNVKKIFNAGRPSEFVALNNICLNVEANKITAITGPSGSGKTTLLTIIGCMARPSSGRVFLDEQEVTSLPERFLTDIRRKTFGFIFQQPNLIRGLTTLENVMLPAYPLGIKRALLREHAMSLLESLRLSDKATAKVDWLSGGEAQRVSIARALINNPSAIITDEPTAHLDSAASSDFLKVIRQFKDEGKTVLISSHDPLVYDSGIVDHVISLRDGIIEERR